jgi:hypothetical protein
MNAKSLFAGILLAGAVSLSFLLFYQQENNAALAAQRQAESAELTILKERAAALETQLAMAETDRDRFKAEAVEVHKLRGEVSTLRKANQTLEKQMAQPRVAAGQPDQPGEPAPVPGQTPAKFSNYSDLAQEVGTLRKKMSSGTPLDADEVAWLKQTKTELDKLESSPQDFAAFQSSMIQTVAGVTDPEKVERIRQGIQKVYENAVRRGLTIENRPADDPAWVEQRHQLDRRGTAAVQRILDDNERAAFDRSFLGIMGADLGTGVDKTLYPPGFLVEAPRQ